LTKRFKIVQQNFFPPKKSIFSTFFKLNLSSDESIKFQNRSFTPATLGNLVLNLIKLVTVVFVVLHSLLCSSSGA